MLNRELLKNWDKLPENEQKKISAAINKEYFAQLEQPGGRQKISNLHRDQLKHYLRESCILDKVLPPEDISPDECEVGPTNDTLFKRIYGQFETRAFQGSFEALPPETQEVYVNRIFLGFTMLTSAKYVVNDYNLLAYPFPLTKQIEDQIGLDMHEAKDWVMRDRLEAAIQNSRFDLNNVIRGVQAQAEIGGSGPGTGNRFPIEREDLIALKQYFVNSRSRANCAVIPEANYLEFERYDINDFGDDMTAEVFRSGLDADKIHGLKMIRTIKTDSIRGDVFRTGNIYAFATANEIGRNFNLRGLKFYLERDHQYLQFDAQMAFGFIWAAPTRIAKLELYNGGRATDGTLLSNILDPSGNPVPASDAYFGTPQEVTFKDYLQFDQERYQPLIRFQ